SLDTGNVVENAETGEVEVSAAGAVAVAGGIGVLGKDMQVENRGGVAVRAEGGALALGIGLAAIDLSEGGNQLHNHGSIAVEAEQALPVEEGGLAAAIGMAGLGTGHYVENDLGARVDVSSVGIVAGGAGIAVLGTDNTVENFGEVSVNAEAADIALALGLASMAPGDAGNTVHNHGRVDVSAYGVGGFEAEFAAAVGMVGLGTGNELENGEGSTLWVRAAGENALAGGMLVVGQDNTIHNAGTVDV